MKKQIIILILLLAATNMFAQKKWTLRECVIYALENNISVKQSELDLEATNAEKLSAIGNFLPSINANANVSENTGLSLNPTNNELENTTFLSASGAINVGYTLFDGLRNFRSAQRAKISKLAAEHRLDKMKDDISLFVANAYLQVLLNKANLEVLVAQNNVTKEQITRTQDLVDAGVLPRGDLLEIQATDASEIQNIVTAENVVQISLISLAQLLLIKEYETFDIEDEGYDIVDDGVASKSVDEIIANAKETRSEIKIAESDVALAEKDLQLSRGSYYPTVSAFFGYNTRYADNDPLMTPFSEQLYLNDGIGYGLQLNVPVLNGLNVRSNVKRNRVNLERTRFQLEQAKLDLESNIYQAYVDVQGAFKAYEAAEKAFESQELAYQYAKDRYDVGLTNAFDFSQSKLRFDNASIEVNRTKYDYIFKLKVLELYFGIPATELKF
ncbi:MAG: TolC family protein [Bacteroidia bacterium]|nr:TolC family protein [Bacteroidia bacterium]NNF30568.1 TolC family protein [Flavobacteriaceae bacterium]MBT8277098.1 TolC family protein [Bacteroidia bacterium]NNJ81285.1 TolC family protein [Flavobacteriaceae bacterium]NNK53111.1 TolC family protein [Flavobacteriaceae bacterium]